METKHIKIAAKLHNIPYELFVQEMDMGEPAVREHRHNQVHDVAKYFKYSEHLKDPSCPPPAWKIAYDYVTNFREHNPEIIAIEENRYG